VVKITIEFGTSELFCRNENNKLRCFSAQGDVIPVFEIDKIHVLRDETEQIEVSPSMVTIRQKMGCETEEEDGIIHLNCKVR